MLEEADCKEIEEASKSIIMKTILKTSCCCLMKIVG